ncbi:hypothetical protein [Domibacillus aminovorans]|uniref:Uncharacterized protein n=1 Tax=Domibacillus aminovorans TaxID=29332 RepID=A0A177L5B2_9BACI|nr:hypothetical protein [Domibacillus aminovorans]OAH60743.1 hypothetical protein AWH49_15495 [Domibacillus aminovorans]
MQLEIKTSHGQTFVEEVADYNAATLANELNDITNRKTVFAIGNIVLNRNAIVYIAPVGAATTGEQA